MAERLDKKEFSKIRAALTKYDKEREKLILASREIIKISKLIIYSIQRNDIKKADSMMKDIKKKVSALPKEEFSTGMKHVALQEYVEATSLYSFMKTGKIPKMSQLKVTEENYLCGLADLSGELVRVSVNRAINKDFDSVMEIRDLVGEIYEEFLKLDLRNGELRKKSDQIKWALQKLEDMVYNAKDDMVSEFK